MPGLIWGVWAGSFLAGALLTLVVRRRLRRPADPGIPRQREGLGRKFLSYLVIVGGTLALGELPLAGFVAAQGLLALGLVVELSRLTRGSSGRGAGVRRVGIPMILLGSASMISLQVEDPSGLSWALLWLTVATNDGYAQLVGQGWGSHRLAPRLSPAKTWEGLFGGVLAAVGVGALQASLHPTWSLFELLGVVAGTALAANLGDLMESAAKRRLGVKDSSGLLGRHGGLLDRFDSLLLAAPVFRILTSGG